MNSLFVICQKQLDGSVNVFNYQGKFWMNIKKYSSFRPDYRSKKITLNCYCYPIIWKKNNYD